jgi:hypothetical protein
MASATSEGALPVSSAGVEVAAGVSVTGTAAGAACDVTLIHQLCLDQILRVK